MQQAAAYRFQHSPRSAPRVRGSSFRILARASEGGQFPLKANAMSFPRIISGADWGNSVVASNKRLHELLIEISRTPGLHPLRCAFPCASGTLAAYVEPNTPFNKSRLFSNNEKAIIFTNVKINPSTKKETVERYVFPVPQEHLGKADAALVSEHPDYHFVRDGNELWAIAPIVDCVEGFPSRNGFYRADEKHGIPFGEEFYLWRGGSGYLWRKEGGAVVSVVRGKHGAHCDSVNMDETLLAPFGALLEAPMEKPRPVPQEPPKQETTLVEGVSPDDLERMLAAAQACMGNISQRVGEKALADIQTLLTSLGGRN